MRSLPEAREESLSPREIVTAGLAVIGFVGDPSYFFGMLGDRHSD